MRRLERSYDKVTKILVVTMWNRYLRREHAILILIFIRYLIIDRRESGKEQVIPPVRKKRLDTYIHSYTISFNNLKRLDSLLDTGLLNFSPTVYVP